MASSSPTRSLDPALRWHVKAVALFVIGILIAASLVGWLAVWFEDKLDEGAGFLLMAAAFAWPLVLAIGLVLAVAFLGASVIFVRDGIALSRTVATGRHLALWAAPAGLAMIALGLFAVFAIAAS